MFLDFPNKRAFFHAQLKAYVRGYCAAPGGGSHFPSISLPISREHVLLDSKAAFDALRGEAALRGRLEVAYKGEEGIDAGGLSREWYTIVAREMFRPDYGMWRLS